MSLPDDPIDKTAEELAACARYARDVCKALPTAPPEVEAEFDRWLNSQRTPGPRRVVRKYRKDP